MHRVRQTMYVPAYLPLRPSLAATMRSSAARGRGRCSEQRDNVVGHECMWVRVVVLGVCEQTNPLIDTQPEIESSIVATMRGRDAEAERTKGIVRKKEAGRDRERGPKTSKLHRRQMLTDATPGNHAITARHAQHTCANAHTHTHRRRRGLCVAPWSSADCS